MSFVYIKGTPGSGKTTIRKELELLGYEAHDADDKDMGGPYNNATNERVTYPESPSAEWFAAHSYRLIPEAVKELHKRAADKTIFLCGTAHNEDDVWSEFDQILFLDADEHTIKDRLAARTNSDYGKAPHEMIEIMKKYQLDQQKKLRPGVTLIDATLPINGVVQAIIKAADK